MESNSDDLACHKTSLDYTKQQVYIEKKVSL